MATPNRFLNGFPTTQKSESHSSSGDARVKRAGPENGDSIGDCEGQVRIQIGENVAFD